MQEIERKFLVDNFTFPLDHYPKSKIEKGYVLLEPEISVSRYGDEFYYCTKSNDSLTREISLLKIDEMTFSFFMRNTTYVINKTRYYIPLYDELVGKLDIYHGLLEGLKTVEVEFNDTVDQEYFIKPFWFGKEVTSNKTYKDKNLTQLESIKQLVRK